MNEFMCVRMYVIRCYKIFLKDFSLGPVMKSPEFTGSDGSSVGFRGSNGRSEGLLVLIGVALGLMGLKRSAGFTVCEVCMDYWF